jgi:hypothetical protein
MLTDKSNHFLKTKILEGLRRKRVQSSDVRAPVTLDLLRRLLQALQKVCISNYELGLPFFLRVHASIFCIIENRRNRVGQQVGYTSTRNLLRGSFLTNSDMF